MHKRTFGRLGWQVSEVGFGMFGVGWWSGSDDDRSLAALELATELGCNFFDTAWEYGEGRAERVLARLLHAHPDEQLYVATKIPPKTMVWPSHRGDPLEDSFPPDHIREYVEKSLQNLELDSIDLIQFHVWEDDWADDERWQTAMAELKSQGLVTGVGISVNRWEPANASRTLATGLIDAVQVVYNIFDQAPEDELLPLCRDLDIAVIARVPFDEGSLTGTLDGELGWPDDDWRTTYFTSKNLAATLPRIDSLKPLLPPGMTLAELALRFILANPDVSVVIPGMREADHVRANLAVGDGAALDPQLLSELRTHRWDRAGAEWYEEAQA